MVIVLKIVSYNETSVHDMYDTYAKNNTNTLVLFCPFFSNKQNPWIWMENNQRYPFLVMEVETTIHGH